MLFGGLYDDAAAIQTNRSPAAISRKGKLGTLPHLDQRTVREPHHGPRTTRRADVFALSELGSNREWRATGIRNPIEKAVYVFDHASRSGGSRQQIVSHLPRANAHPYRKSGGRGPPPLRSAGPPARRTRRQLNHLGRPRPIERVPASRAAVNMIFEQ